VGVGYKEKDARQEVINRLQFVFYATRGHYGHGISPSEMPSRAKVFRYSLRCRGRLFRSKIYRRETKSTGDFILEHGNPPGPHLECHPGSVVSFGRGETKQFHVSVDPRSQEAISCTADA
jgi:hypothetical protein